MGGEAGVAQMPPLCLVLSGLGALPMQIGWPESGLVGSSVTGGMGSQAPLLLLPSYLCWQAESCVLLPLLLLGFLKLWAQLPQSEGWDCRYRLHCSLGSASSMCSSSPTFRCTHVWNSLASCCVGERHLRCVVDVLLVVDSRGETKVAFHSTMFLTALSYKVLMFPKLINNIIFKNLKKYYGTEILSV